MGCLTCGAKGFDQSPLGPHRCSFCDGSEGGNPPTEQDIAEEHARLRKEIAHGEAQDQA